MDPTTRFCPNKRCSLYGKIGEGNIGIKSQKEKRFVCHVCGKTFAATTGTVFYRLKYEAEFVSQVIALLSHGCPPAAIVAAFDLDERTVDDWPERAETHTRQVHEHTVQQGQLDLGQVQADEIRGKIQGSIVWLAMAIAVPTRLWLDGVVGRARNQDLLDALACRSKPVPCVVPCRSALTVWRVMPRPFNALSGPPCAWVSPVGRA